MFITGKFSGELKPRIARKEALEMNDQPDIIAVLKKMQLQLDSLEKKIDALVGQSSQKPFRPFTPSFRKGGPDRGPRENKESWGNREFGNREPREGREKRDFRSGRPFEKREGGAPFGGFRGKKKFFHKRKER